MVVRTMSAHHIAWESAMVEKIGGGVQLSYLYQCPGGKPPLPDGTCPGQPSVYGGPAQTRKSQPKKANPCPPEQERIVKTRDKTGRETATRRVTQCFEEKVKLNPQTHSYEAVRSRRVNERPRRVGND